MNATIVSRTTTSFTLQLEIPYNGSMLDFEETLQDRLNEAGVVATAEGLQQFDTDGSPIAVGSVKFTSKGQVEKDYQTPYGVATVARHVYQGTRGELNSAYLCETTLAKRGVELTTMRASRSSGQ